MKLIKIIKLYRKTKNLKQRIKSQLILIISAFKVFDGFCSQSNFPSGAFNKICHDFSSVKNLSGLLILVNVNCDFINKLFINMFVLSNQCKKSVNFRVQIFIFIKVHIMLSSQFLLFRNDNVKLILLNSNVCFDFVQSG